MRACSFSFFFSHQTPAHLYTLSLHDALPISITVTLTLDGTGKVDVKTGLGFLDHLLEALSRHARFDVTLACEGDLHVDDHHTRSEERRVGKECRSRWPTDREHKRYKRQLPAG